MSASLASISDLEDRWRPISDSEATKVDTLLGDASALLRAEFPSIDDTIASGALQAEVVAAVVSQMVKRALLAPADGIASETAGAGPFSQTQQYANPLGNVFLTAAERTLIRGYRPKAMTGTFA